MDFSQVLKSILADSGTSIYRLAKEIGVHQTTIKNWIDHKTNPSAEIVAKIATYFGLPVSYLIEGYYVPHFYPSPILFEVRKKLGPEFIFDGIEEETWLMKKLPNDKLIGITEFKKMVNNDIESSLVIFIGNWDDFFLASDFFFSDGEDLPDDQQSYKNHHFWIFNDSIDNLKVFVEKRIESFIDFPNPFDYARNSTQYTPDELMFLKQLFNEAGYHFEKVNGKYYFTGHKGGYEITEEELLHIKSMLQEFAKFQCDQLEKKYLEHF